MINLTFVNVNEYRLAKYTQTSPTEITWRYQDEHGRNHSGSFIAGRKSNHLRDGEEFEPFAEVLELGLTPEFDQVAYDAKLATEQKEAARIALKNKREADLQAITHDFGDGRIVQVRPQDVSNFQFAIAKNSATEWIMEDNTVVELTVEELQTAFASGVAQGEKIYMDYMQALKAL